MVAMFRIMAAAGNVKVSNVGISVNQNCLIQNESGETSAIVRRRQRSACLPRRNRPLAVNHVNSSWFNEEERKNQRDNA